MPLLPQPPFGLPSLLVKIHGGNMGVCRGRMEDLTTKMERYSIISCISAISSCIYPQVLESFQKNCSIKVVPHLHLSKTYLLICFLLINDIQRLPTSTRKKNKGNVLAACAVKSYPPVPGVQLTHEVLDPWPWLWKRTNSLEHLEISGGSYCFYHVGI